MAKEQFSMTATQIAEIVGTVGSPLVVISELLKNAVDASAENINICYNHDNHTICIENDHSGITLDEIEKLSHPGISHKKRDGLLTNERGMFLTGSKGLGLLSVFSLCAYAEIYTALEKNSKIYKVTLERANGLVEWIETSEMAEEAFTKVIMQEIDQETLDFLSSEKEVRKLRHICTNLYKEHDVPFPKMILHISGQEPNPINFSCPIPSMLFDVRFTYQKESQTLKFYCLSPEKHIYEDEVVFDRFDLESLQKVMLEKFRIKETIATRTNEISIPFEKFEKVPSFEGRILVYEKNLAGAQLKTYGPGVNIYVNEFALYNYLSEDNDWLGLADFSQRKKVTRLKPHNVFGYVNFPAFNENEETLKISNERTDFIQDLTFSKLMYLLKGVVLFAIFNIDVADKNPKYKGAPPPQKPSGQDENNGKAPDKDNTPQSEDDDSSDSDEDNGASPPPSASGSGTPPGGSGPYSPSGTYMPKKSTQKSLFFTEKEGEVIEGLKGTDDLCNKIYNMVYELSKLDLQVHRYSIAYLFRALLESATKYLSQRQSSVVLDKNSLSSSITSALNYLGNLVGKGKPLVGKEKNVKLWRDTVNKRHMVDILNEYVHNEQPVDTLLLQETWNTMKGYIITCLTVV